MGTAFLQTEGNNIGSTIKARVENWPSANKAEIVAIALAILTVPVNSKIIIKTDCASCITTFHKLLDKDPKLTHKRWLKTNNWMIWFIIMENIQTKNLNISMQYVRAYASEKFNEKVNQLAKEATLETPIKLKNYINTKLPTVSTWKDIVIDISIRDYIKNFNKKIVTFE
jgi:ribonuclease HI